MFSAIPGRLTPRSIRTQLVLWYLLMLAAALAAFAAFVFALRAGAVFREVDADLSIRARQLLAELEPALLHLDVEEALIRDPRFASDAIMVRERTGRGVFRSPSFPTLGATEDSFAAEAVREGNPLTTVRSLAGDEYRLATVIAERPGAPALVLQVAQPITPVWNSLRQLALGMLLFFTLVLVAASWGGSFIARRALRPVDVIVGRVRAIKASQLGERLELPTGSEELDRLVMTLNEMMDGIEASMRSARRFAADASHELQTPIAAMRAALEVELREDTGPAEPRVLAVDLLSDIERLSGLVRDLRLLALADAGHLLGRLEPVSLNEIVDDACEVIRAIGESRGIDVRVEAHADLAVSGNAPHLRRVFLNLVHNAVRYSVDGATVSVVVAPQGGDAVVTVIDEGCGIAPDDLPHIFERFYRADPARARDSGGTGLGLAIADQIVRLHGGRIEVTSELHRGSKFSVILPASHELPLARRFPSHSITAF